MCSRYRLISLTLRRGVSVLEGIGLSNNPKYSIINACLPFYVSKRLLTDKSEHTIGALPTFFFGSRNNDSDRIIDYHRAENRFLGLEITQLLLSGVLEKSRIELIDDLADRVLDLLATEEETPLQNIFIEQISKIMAAVWSNLRERSGTPPMGRSILGTLVDAIGIFRTNPVVRMNSLDEEIIESTRRFLYKSQSDLNQEANVDVSRLSGLEVQHIHFIEQTLK